MTEPRDAPWWKGAHGEWLVAAQIALMLLVFFGPRTVWGRPSWPFPLPSASLAAGVALMVLGATLMIAAVQQIGRGLTPLPYPKEGATLVRTGPFGVVRHPMYSGGLLLALGYALVVRGWLTLAYVAALFVLLDAKARREERWLIQRYPDYPAYQKHVRRLIPFVY